MSSPDNSSLAAIIAKAPNQTAYYHSAVLALATTGEVAIDTLISQLPVDGRTVALGYKLLERARQQNREILAEHPGEELLFLLSSGVRRGQLDKKGAVNEEQLAAFQEDVKGFLADGEIVLKQFDGILLVEASEKAYGVLRASDVVPGRKGPQDDNVQQIMAGAVFIHFPLWETDKKQRKLHRSRRRKRAKALDTRTLSFMIVPQEDTMGSRRIHTDSHEMQHFIWSATSLMRTLRGEGGDYYYDLFQNEMLAYAVTARRGNLLGLLYDSEYTLSKVPEDTLRKAEVTQIISRVLNYQFGLSSDEIIFSLMQAHTFEEMQEALLERFKDTYPRSTDRVYDLFDALHDEWGMSCDSYKFKESFAVAAGKIFAGMEISLQEALVRYIAKTYLEDCERVGESLEDGYYEHIMVPALHFDTLCEIFSFPSEIIAFENVMQYAREHGFDAA